MPLRIKWKRFAALFSAAAALLTGCTGKNSGGQSPVSKADVPAVTGEVSVTVFDVGKADAMVIQTANSVTVVDAGNKGDGKEIERFLTAQGIDTINTLMITHYDKDHVGGAARLVNRMNVETIYVPDYTGTSEEYQSFLEKIGEKGKELTKLAAGTEQSWVSDDAAFQLFAANKSNYGKNEENDFSLVLYIQHGENTLLFAGDAEEARQQEIMAMSLGEVTFLKFPYHGNYLSTTENFLNSVKPKYAVICCSNQEYADPSTVQTLKDRGVAAYYTPDGTVTAVSDGKSITVTQAAEK
ncbi:MAG: MBL fold metallo-hydrolase [Oscillospiraceae bacterium]|nr:MBL fold metallo-hydrolase [Oscillospiraceae bacterium]